MPALGVTLDSLAFLRESRKTREPDPVGAAFIAERAGAQAINVHLRADRRHIQERDVSLLRETVTTELNLVAAAGQDLTRIALTFKPDRVTFVPERLEGQGGDLGVDVILNSAQLRQLVRLLRDGAIRATIFIEPELDQVKEAHRIDAHGVELSAHAYATARDREEHAQELRRLSDAARLASKFGLEVAVGHGLGFRNVGALCGVVGLNRVNVGFSLVARALWVGFEKAVREMVDALGRPVEPPR
jgi:pyridoxine 5-phosphate synthase